jgi:TRAP-type C4-dicarboxylate transport system permease small subunit
MEFQEHYPKAFRLIQKVDRFWARIEGMTLVFALLLMIVLAFTQAILRNFFSTGVFWFEPLVRHLVLFVGFMGASLATHEKRHITVDALGKVFKQSSRHYVNILVTLVSFLICVILFWASIHFVIDTYGSGEKIHGNFPSWLAQSIMPYAFAVMALRFILDFLGHFVRLLKGLPPAAGMDAHISLGEELGKGKT